MASELTDEERVRVGAYLARQRGERTVASVAASAGVTAHTWAAWERGIGLRAAAFPRIADAIGVTEEEIRDVTLHARRETAYRLRAEGRGWPEIATAIREPSAWHAYRAAALHAEREGLEPPPELTP